MSVLLVLLALTSPAEAQSRGGGERTPPASDEPGRGDGGARQPDPAPAPAPAPKPAPTKDEEPEPKTGGKRGKKKKKKKKKGYKIDSLNPLAGTFVYGPKLGTHHKYVGAAGKKRPTTVAKKDLPERDVDRKETKFFGLRAGGMFYEVPGETLSEPGAGVAAGYRFFEAVGFQVDFMHHADSFPGAEHANTLLGASGELFLFPWKAVSPYAHLGVVQNFRGGGGITNIASVFGTRGGLGLQLAMGKSAALDIEGTIIGWNNQKPDDPTSPIAGQLTAGLVFHF